MHIEYRLKLDSIRNSSLFSLHLHWLYLLFRLLPRLTVRQGSYVSAFFPFFLFARLARWRCTSVPKYRFIRGLAAVWLRKADVLLGHTAFSGKATVSSKTSGIFFPKPVEFNLRGKTCHVFFCKTSAAQMRLQDASEVEATFNHDLCRFNLCHLLRHLPHHAHSRRTEWTKCEKLPSEIIHGCVVSGRSYIITFFPLGNLD